MLPSRMTLLETGYLTEINSTQVVCKVKTAIFPRKKALNRARRKSSDSAHVYSLEPVYRKSTFCYTLRSRRASPVFLYALPRGPEEPLDVFTDESATRGIEGVKADPRRTEVGSECRRGLSFGQGTDR